MTSHQDAHQDASAVTFRLPSNTLITQELLTAFDHFLLLNEDLSSVSKTFRRLFFEFLRTQPNLSGDEVDDIRGLADFLAECRQLKAAIPSAAAA
jgi:hypothetical protein